MQVFIIIITVIGVLFILGILAEIITRKRNYDKRVSKMTSDLKTLRTEIIESQKAIDSLIAKCDKTVNQSKYFVQKYGECIDEAIKMMSIVQQNYRSVDRKIEILANAFDEADGEIDQNQIKEYIALINKDIQANDEAVELLTRHYEQQYRGPIL